MHNDIIAHIILTFRFLEPIESFVPICVLKYVIILFGLTKSFIPLYLQSTVPFCNKCILRETEAENMENLHITTYTYILILK